ncbi:MAG: hypothetical protein J0M30_05765 [Chitinophagales bacterium]|nr:hypothetical protein [Chitinophagales bacterium]
MLFLFFENTEQQATHHRAIDGTILPFGRDEAGTTITTYLLPVKIPAYRAYCNTSDKKFII